MSFLSDIENAALDKAHGLVLKPGKVVAKNANGSYQVVIDGATYYQVYSYGGVNYAPNIVEGPTTFEVPVEVVIDGFGRPTIVP